jgi:type IV pilus biogenesis protein PilP
MLKTAITSALIVFSANAFAANTTQEISQDELVNIDCQSISEQDIVNNAFTLMTAPAMSSCLELKVKMNESMLKITEQTAKRESLKAELNGSKSSKGKGRGYSKQPSPSVVSQLMNPEPMITKSIVQPAPAKVPKLTIPTKSRLNLVSLSGTDETGYTASISINGARYNVEKGMSIDNFKVVSISSEGVTLTRKGETRLISTHGSVKW